jgi:uncharacterized protein (TIGR03032 family)
MTDATPDAPAEKPWVEVYSSRDFPGWLAQERIALALTTYQAGKLFLIGLAPDGKLSVFERTFSRCLGLWSDGQTLWMSSKFQLWRFENVLRPGQFHQGYDRLYVPRAAHTTGDLDVHDLAVEASGRVVFVSTRFNCLATLSPRDSFAPLWRPPFVSQLVPEDRCHLNGLAVHEGRARYVTAVAASDVVDGWRDRRRDGGLLIDVTSGRALAERLSMPHSPRVYRERIWLCDSGSGRLGSVPLEGGSFEPLAFAPGYLRGLAFAGELAIVGLSGPREAKTFGGLPLDDELAARRAEPRCGLHVIDLATGDTLHWLRIEGLVSEIYDVAVLPGVVRPMALGLKTDEIEHLLSVDETQTL